MELVKNLRWVCRVCAVNMKEKFSELASVHIFGPAQVHYKMKKYFGIDLNRGDVLPKNICKVCYRKLEDFHNFARLAKKTDRFLKAFVNSVNSDSVEVSNAEFTNRFQTEFASFAFSTESDTFKSRKSKIIANDRKVTSLDAIKIKEKRLTMTRPMSSTSVSNAQNPSRNNLEEKRQHLKAVLATSNAAAQSQPRIKVKSEHDLKSPQLNVNLHPSQQPMKVITIPQVTSVPTNSQNSLYGNRLKLGQVVKDIDLLTLILKALKWPYTNDNILVQIEQLKEAPFHEVIRNQNLLQDADLMQILNTILSPILLQRPLVAQQQPIIPAFVSYKIPADLSVQLITEEVVDDIPIGKPLLGNQSRRSINSKIKPATRKQRQPRAKTKTPQRCSSPIEILSDDDSVQMFEVDVDPNLYFNLDSESQENSNSYESPKKDKRNDDLLKFKIQKKQRRKESHVKRNNELLNEVHNSKPEIIIPDKLFETAEDINEKLAETADPKVNVQPSPSNKSMGEDISGDDDAWSEFKVTESPDTSVEIEKTTTAVCIKEESIQKVEDSINLPLEESGDVKSSVAEKQIIVKEEPKLKEEKSNKEPISPNEEKPSKEDKPPPRKRGRPKNSTNVDEKVARTDDESKKKGAPDNSSTNKPVRKSANATAPSQQNGRTRATRSLPSTPPVMSLRNCNLRRRICKQCGQSFTLLADFLDHRKMHT